LLRKKKDHVLLLLSGGLGIQFAGSAIASALGVLFVRGPVVKATGIFLVLLHLTNLYVWWRAFRQVDMTSRVFASSPGIDLTKTTDPGGTRDPSLGK
jgi:membrane protein implicated in regulation of membrane protease activity